jgi:hypothetical protein
MSDMGFPVDVPDTIAPDTEPQVLAILDAILLITDKAKMSASTSMAEAKDAADAVLKFAQAIVVLDPTLNQQGIPLDHELALKQVEMDGMERLEKAKQTAAAPQPAKTLKGGR